MKLQIKTLNKKSLLIEIEDTKTVYDLKIELSLYADVGVQPEFQKLIYSGKVLANEHTLMGCHIDANKFLVLMILKKPEEEPLPPTDTTATSQTTTITTKETESPSSTVQEPSKTTEKSKNEQMVDNITSMGYPESEVRQALIASFHNPERAIEYLIEGIPSATVGTSDFYTDVANASNDISLDDLFSRDPLFQNLRRSILQHPELIERAIQRIGETNPSIMNMINENPQEYLTALLEGSEDENGEDENYDITKSDEN